MQNQLFAMSMQVCKKLKQATGADKMNVANLGNMVRQLHVHVVARHVGDAAWPGPIWGVGEAQAHEAPDKTIQAMRDLLDL
jgi:diadenosine tetraphosphate (Ap4A) HIT family hydrolase